MGTPPGEGETAEETLLKPNPQRPIPQVGPLPWDYQERWGQSSTGKTDTREIIFRGLKRLGTFSTLTLFIYLSIAAIILLLMIPEIIEGLGDKTGVLFIVTPAVVPIAFINGAVLAGFFVILVIAIISSFIYTWGCSASRFWRELVVGKPERHSAMLAVGGLLFAILMSNFIYYNLISIGGVDPTIPDFESDPFWESVYGFAKASVWEEIVSRILLIGVPLLWIDFLFRRDRMLPLRRYYLGGDIEFGAVECTLIFFSALMFGLGHVQSWDIWKAFPASIAGLAFGFLFVRYGLFSAIVLHFAFNFLDVPLSYFNADNSFLFALLFLFWLLIGLMFLIFYAMQLGRFLFGRSARTDESR